MFFSIVSIFIGLYALINFKKSLMIFTIYQIFWYPTTLLQIGGIGLNSNFILPLWYAFLFYLRKRSYMLNKRKFPFSIPFWLIGISYFFSCFTAISGFMPELNRALMRIFSTYIFIFILWYVVDSRKDLKFIFNGVTLTMFFAAIYGIIEYFFGANILLSYKVTLSDYTLNLYDSSGLRGYRLTSFFEHPLGAGMMFGLYSTFYFSLMVRNERVAIKNKLGMLTALLCLPCVILTKMRTAIIFTIILMVMIFINKKFTKLAFSRIFLGSILIIPILIIVICTNSELITNLFSSQTSSEIGGSSLSMRLDQFAAIKMIIKPSPVFGLGETFRSSIVNNALTASALGYEGIIFEQLSMHGYFGLFVTIILMYFSIIKVPLKYKSKEVAIISIAYWLSYLVSSIPSFRLPFLYLTIFYFIKTSNIYKERNSL